MNNKKLLRNTILLTSSGLLMRVFAMSFQVWLAGRIGDAGIGLFQLVSSVQLLCATFAISGIRFAATRLLSEEIGQNRPGGVRRVMRLCLEYSLFFGTAALCILWLCAESIGFLWIGDARTVRSLRLIAWSMPFLSMASVFSGYFTSMGRVWKSALSQVCEQIVRISLVAFFLTKAPAGDLEACCAAVVLGGSLAEVFSFLLYLLLYLTDRRRHVPRGQAGERLPARMLGVAVPLALSSYTRTALSTLQHLLVPRGLKASGLSADKALAGYGIVHGMAFPIVLFPSCILMALAEMLVPGLTEAQMAGKTEEIHKTVNRMLSRCLLFSLGIAAALFANAEGLGNTVYHNAEAGRYIRIYAPLVPVMYMDMVTDGCLRGLGEHLWTMAVNIADSAVSVLLVLLLLPKYALAGYVAILWATEVFNFVLSICRLRKVAGFHLSSRTMLVPVLCSVGSAAFTALLRQYVPLPGSGVLPCGIWVCASLLLYGFLLFLCGEFDPASLRLRSRA